MNQVQKHWRSKRIKSTLPDRIGKDAARLWYTISLICAKRELEHFVARKIKLREELYAGGWDALAFIDRYEVAFNAFDRAISKRHAKIERLKRFLNNLQK